MPVRTVEAGRGHNKQQQQQPQDLSLFSEYIMFVALRRTEVGFRTAEGQD